MLLFSAEDETGQLMKPKRKPVKLALQLFLLVGWSSRFNECVFL